MGQPMQVLLSALGTKPFLQIKQTVSFKQETQFKILQEEQLPFAFKIFPKWQAVQKAELLVRQLKQELLHAKHVVSFK